jgi:DNA-binding MarR family transcriptional regulator
MIAPREQPSGFPPLTVSRPALLADGRDDTFRELVRDLVDFSARLQGIREEIARAMGVSSPQYNILMCIAHCDDQNITVGQLAELLRVSVPFVVTETRRLVDAGLLIKQNDVQDRRRVYLHLTPQAVAAMTEVAPLQRGVNDILFESLGQKELAQLKTVISGLLQSCAPALAEAEKSAAARRVSAGV